MSTDWAMIIPTGISPDLISSSRAAATVSRLNDAISSSGFVRFIFRAFIFLFIFTSINQSGKAPRNLRTKHGITSILSLPSRWETTLAYPTSEIGFSIQPLARSCDRRRVLSRLDATDAPVADYARLLCFRV